MTLKFLSSVENMDVDTTITEFDFFAEITKGVTEQLRLDNITLNESYLFETPENIWNKTITSSYRLTRESLEQMGEFGKKQAQEAARQARKMLYMKPQVLHGNMADIKALGIKIWNETLEKCLKNQLLNEYGLAHEEAMNIARGFIGKKTLQTVTDAHLRDSILEMGKAVKRHIIKTIDNMYRVVLYRYKDTDYVVIEAPGKKPEVFK